MRKFFSLIAAVLFAGSMMAQVTILPTDFTPVEASDYSVTKDGVTVAVTASTVTNDQMRIFKGKTITISAESNISSIEFTCTANGTAKYGPGCFNAQDGYTFEAAGKKGTWVGSATSVTFTAESNQVRATQIVVTLGGEVPPIEPTEEYYLTGSIRGWAQTADEDYKFVVNTAAEGEYMLQGITLAANDELKVIGLVGETLNWYPDGQGNNYVVAADGTYDIYFRQDGQGGEDWHQGYFYVAEVVPPTAISCLEVYQMAKNDVVGLLNPVTVTYSNGANVWVMDGSASMLIYLPSGFTNNFQAGDILSGISGVVDIYQNIVYEVKPSADQAAAIVATPGEAPAPSQAAVIEASDVNKYVILPGFSIEGEFTTASKTSLSAVLGENTVTIYNNFKFAYTFEAGKTYDIIGVVSAYKGNPQVYFISAEESGIVEPTVEYQLTGSFRNWGTTVEADYQFVSNPVNEGEYMLRRVSLSANDEIKVIGILEPTEGEPTYTWYPDGEDNNYVITEDGEYNIYFRPEGNIEGWHYGYFYVQPYVIPTYDVAEAIAAAPENGDEMYVRGVITKMQIKGKNFAKYGSVIFYVADATGAEGEFEFFNCYPTKETKFTTTKPAYDETSTTFVDLRMVTDEEGNEFRLGDTIVAFGAYKLFNTTHELDGGCFITEHIPAPVQPAQTINVDMSEGLYFDNYVESDGWWDLYGANDQFVIELSNIATEEVPGTYTMDDLDPDYCFVGIINGEDTTYISFEDGSITLTRAENGDVTISGTLAGDDDNNYVLNISFVAPQVEQKVDVVILDGALYDEYAEDGLYAIYGGDASEVYVQLAIWAKGGLRGEFSEQDLDKAYIGSAIYEGETAIAIYSATIIVVPGEDGSYAITATVLGYNNKEYTVTMDIPAPDPTGIEETIATGKAAKILRDGQLLIRKADKTFNVMGATIR